MGGFWKGQNPRFSHFFRNFSRERLAKGSGLVWNYGRAEVALVGGERQKSAGNKNCRLKLAAENPRKKIAGSF